MQMKQPRKSAAFNPHPWSPEQHQAWEEMPKGYSGWIAPATELYRDKWRVWWGKWGKQFHFTPVHEGYRLLDLEKAKNLTERYPVGHADSQRQASSGHHQGSTGVAP